MKTIWKYPLLITDRQTISTPFGSKILYVGKQPEFVCVWVEVELETNREEDHTIVIVRTGDPVPQGPIRFINTVIDNHFVWHIYEML